MSVEQPAEPFQSFPVRFVGLSPLLLADFVDRLVEIFDDVEAVQDQGRILAVGLDGSNVGFAHVAAGPRDLGFLVVAEGLGEEPVDGLTPFTCADPDHTGPIQVVDDRGILVALSVGDLINPYRLETSDLVPLPTPFDGPVQQV